MAVVEYSLFEHRIVTGSGALSALNLDLSARNFQQILVLCDDQTFHCCYPLLLEAAPVFSAANVFCVPAGESSKNLDVAVSVWQEMTRLGMTRNGVLVNLGGGMVSDLGGFVAATYLRGIPFLNVPTSLLAQVDAAIGGKTGVDLYGAKNRVGLTVFPLGVYSDPCFFKSLPDDEWYSGCAEVVKHALIADASLWSLLQREGLSRDVVSLHLAAIQEVKIAVVQDDPLEKSVRKKLNFGHTIGHAIESSAMEDLQISLSHGRAVAMGMMLESELAFALQLLSEAALEDIRSSLSHWFGKPDLSAFSADRLLEWMWLDKKNRSGEMGFSFVTGPGRCEFVLLRDVDLLRRVLLVNGARS